ncbi:MAG: tyrosine--tRNA ligase, partial [Planctomycetota bacterium]|nr:tyrosine--tRNA ligase [Planctomycetota bacterium]
GDPSGRSEERNLLSHETLAANITAVGNQIKDLLESTNQTVHIVNNADWMRGVGYLEFLRDVGKHVPLSQMLAKDSVKSRLDREGGLSYTEFSYMLLQAFDFVQLCKTHGCRIQAGGSDQWGNITAGIDLARRMLGEQVFGITAPLLTTSDGRKMGKTESGAIWLDANRTSPYQFYQYWRNVDDGDVMRCIAYLTEIDREEYQELSQVTENDPGRRTAQNRLAEWMTEFVHGSDGLTSAVKASKILFGGEIGSQTDSSLGEIFADVPSSQEQKDRLQGEGYWIVEALQAAGLVGSGGEARRAIKDGGVYLNNERVTDDQYRLTLDDLASETVLILRKGKRNYALLKFT